MRLRSIIGSLLAFGLLLIIPMNAVAGSSLLEPIKFYAGGSIALAHVKGCEDATRGGTFAPKGCDDIINSKKFSGDLFVGAKIGQYAFLEFMYIPTISTTEKFTVFNPFPGGTGGESDEFKISSFAGIIGLRYPVSQHFIPYVRFGVVYSEIKEIDKGMFPTPFNPKDVGLSGLYGLGAECQFYDHFFARVGYDWMPDLTGWNTGRQHLNEQPEDNRMAAADINDIHRLYISIYYQF